MEPVVDQRAGMTISFCVLLVTVRGPSALLQRIACALDDEPHLISSRKIDRAIAVGRHKSIADAFDA